MSQLLPLVGPAGHGPTGYDPATAEPNPAAATRSIITIQKVKLKDLHLTCEFTEQRTDDAPPAPSPSPAPSRSTPT